MEGRVLSLKGKTKKKVALPELFEESYRPDLIKKAVVVSQANRRQAYGPQRTAGLKTSAHSWGSGRGVAQVPRLKNSSRATGRRWKKGASAVCRESFYREDK
jgi:large subunit ribosomal protein L4e